jgi:hypothetical protein
LSCIGALFLSTAFAKAIVEVLFPRLVLARAHSATSHQKLIPQRPRFVVVLFLLSVLPSSWPILMNLSVHEDLGSDIDVLPLSPEVSSGQIHAGMVLAIT